MQTQIIITKAAVGRRHAKACFVGRVLIVIYSGGGIPRCAPRCLGWGGNSGAGPRRVFLPNLFLRNKQEREWR